MIDTCKFEHAQVNFYCGERLTFAKYTCSLILSLSSFE